MAVGSHPPERNMVQRVKSWCDLLLLICGPLAQLFQLVFFACSNLLPPVSPQQTAEEVSDHYLRHDKGMRCGTYLLLLTSFLWPLYSAGINNQLARIPHVPQTSLLLQMSASCVFALIITLSSIMFSVAVYRPERDPHIIQLASDTAWLLYSNINGPFIAQNIGIWWAVLSDRRERPFAPHGVAYLSLMLPICLLPAFAAHCVHGGPVSWNEESHFGCHGVFL